ncbi:MAG: hypothetical protein F6K37_23355 [Moorea sp. SIO4E2]|uniref:hypothetical protein n=1 Tax=Moorena sp. SIO4E2 TaxID=2607826 RepID=UPI0013BA667B|nr:hypothetical protein [Moorena sp. SIO4E2]NEQ08771.1 hypothetical protein [Moorena sp. SIO4E2]
MLSYSQFSYPYSLLPTPYSLLPIPYSLNNVEFSEPHKLDLYQSITRSIATGYHQEER